MDSTSSTTVVLNRIQLRNYRSCVDTEFKLQPDLSVLIGPNGSGKTNLLSGLVLLRRLLEADLYRGRREGLSVPEATLKAWFAVGDKSLILTARVQLHTEDTNTDVVIASRESWYAKSITGSSTRIELPLAAAKAFGNTVSPRDKAGFHDSERLFLSPRYYREVFGHTNKEEPAVRAIGQIAAWIRGITYYSASQFTNPSACPVSIRVEREGKRLGVGRVNNTVAVKFLHDLYDAHHAKSAGYSQFVEIIGPRGIGLINNLSFKEIETSAIDYAVRVGGQVTERRVQTVLVVPQFHIGRNVLSPNQLSEGTYKTIALLFYLITRTRSLLLLEEPEVCVHHGLLTSILGLMKAHSARQQVVVSTHSDFVLDQVEPRCVYAVTRNAEGETAVSNVMKSMSGKDLAALRAYLASEGGLGEYWKHGALD